MALRLKAARRERSLTQRQLADLGESTQQNISRYEKGFIPDSWFLLARLHAEKAIDLNWLLGSRLAVAAGNGSTGLRASEGATPLPELISTTVGGLGRPLDALAAIAAAPPAEPVGVALSVGPSAEAPGVPGPAADPTPNVQG
ncbi:MAG: helix-turn-helix transcriptional regulator [Gemmatimonadetes bacterium]|nr:helix-turn-helix transcriptional regulator [Gemmatimonadota bacterium]